MIGRRRRPLLGAAVVVGASRSAARREVAAQSQAEAQRDAQIRAEVDRQRRDEEEAQRRTQRAIDESLAKERERVAMSSRQAVGPPPSGSQAGASNPQARNVRYCGDCGAMCKNEDRFCPGCGARLVVQQQQQQQPPPGYQQQPAPGYQQGQEYRS